MNHLTTVQSNVMLSKQLTPHWPRLSTCSSLKSWDKHTKTKKGKDEGMAWSDIQMTFMSLKPDSETRKLHDTASLLLYSVIQINFLYIECLNKIYFLFSVVKTTKSVKFLQQMLSSTMHKLKPQSPESKDDQLMPFTQRFVIDFNPVQTEHRYPPPHTQDIAIAWKSR